MNELPTCDLTPPPRTLRQLLQTALQHAANCLGSVTIERLTISEIKAARVFDVELALLNAEAEEERYRYSAQMLRERLARLQNVPHHPSTPIPPRPDERAARCVRRTGWNDSCLPVPAGGPARAEPPTAPGARHGGSVEAVCQKADDPAAHTTGSAGGHR